MAKRQRIWASKKRDELRALLGGKCAYCGAKKDLEFDVIFPIDSTHHREMDTSWRMSFYRQQLANGNLQLLCSPCNSRKGDTIGLNFQEKVDAPF